jgi:pimeloyl-ACP methyl ester carboxylesterase
MNQRLALECIGASLVGEGAGSGAEILLLHAGGETRAVWRPVMTTLAGRGFRAVAFDQRGHGESSGSVTDGVLAFGEDAKAMIRQMQRPLVVGASLGGFALMLALRDVEADVSGLVLVDVTPAPDPDRTRAYLAPRGGLGTSPLVEDILSRGPELTCIVGALTLPVLLVCGGANSPMGETGRSEFAALLPHARIQIIDSAGHLVARDAPRDLAEAIITFAGQNGPEIRRA